MSTPPPPPPAGSAPPPPVAGGPAAGPPPAHRGASRPIGFGAAAKTEEERKEERRIERLALRQLAASPELVSLAVLFFFIFGAAIRFNIVGMIFGLAAFALGSWIFLANGDSLLACLLLLGFGLMTWIWLADPVDLDTSSLFWILPALTMVLVEFALSFNHFRRRRGEMSRTIPGLMASNAVAVVGLSVIVAFIGRSIAERDGRVEWPWFATASFVLAAGWLAGLQYLRRTSLPPDRRRFNPGRRMIPPPQ